jgi:hypothetical protein
MKVCEKCGNEIGTRDGDNRCSTCDNASETPKQRKRRVSNRKGIEDALRSCGMTKVRGAMGGVYWE